MSDSISNFDFVDRLYSGRLAKRADQEGIDRLSRQEQTVVLAWWAKGEIDNGGFALLYSHPVDIDRIADAFREMGLEQAANACLASKNLFTGRNPPASLEERRHEVAALGTGAWIENDRTIWNLNDDFDATVARYIQEHKLQDRKDSPSKAYR